MKAKKVPSKPQTPAQNGKTPKGPAGKQVKTPDNKAKGDKKPQTPKAQTPKTPQTPRVPLTVPEVKAKMMASVEKGVMLPKLEQKFENYVKNCFKVTEAKTIEELWKWRQTIKDKN